jgi:hypothetical protein
LTPDDRSEIASVEVGRPIDVGCETCRCCCRVRLRPQAGGNDQGIDSLFLPPGALVAPPVKFAMVQPADRDGEAVADSPAHRPVLGKLDVVGIRRGAAADEARLSRHKPQMVAIAFAYGFANDSDLLGTRPALSRPQRVSVCFPLLMP